MYGIARIGGYVLFAVTMAGCAQYQAQQASRARANEIFAARQQLDAVCNATYENDSVRILHSKIPVTADKASLSQLSDQTKASPQEKIAIAAYEQLSAPCVAAAESYASNYGGPEVVSLYRDYLNVFKILRAQLWNGSLTFGQFNTQRAALDTEFQRKVAAIEQAHAAAVARQQAASDAAAAAMFFQQTQMMQLQQQQMYQNQMQMQNQNRPVQTNCQSYLNTVNCTTQ
jgi:hypothetical protein